MPYDDGYIFDDANIDDMPVFSESRRFPASIATRRCYCGIISARVSGNIGSIPAGSRRKTNWWKYANRR